MSSGLPAIVIGQMLLLPAILAIALVVRVRKPEYFRPRHREGLVARFRAMTQRQRRTSIAVIVGFVVLATGVMFASRSAQLDVLRQQFHLPDDVAIADVSVQRRSTSGRPSAEAIAQFSAEQLDRYVSRLDDATLWRPTLESYGGVPIASYSPGALRWHLPPKPMFVGARRLRVGHASRKAVAVRDGRILCFGLKGFPDQRWEGGKFPEQPTRYAARGCTEFDREEAVGAYVLGILDFETRQLHMIIR